MASLKKNYLLNLINTVAGMVFPLVTFPYASRILEADGIGIVNFYNSIISYISLFTCLGIPLYATREIAKVKYDPALISKTSAEILVLHIFLTLLGYITVAILVFFVPKINEEWPIFLMLSTSLIFNAMGCEWYFRGTEDFKFITIRGLICRIIYIPLLFIFVHNKTDLLMYAGLTVFVTVGNNLFNFYRISRVLRKKEIRDAIKVPTTHLKGSLKIFLLNASISLYIQLNIIVLGFLSSTTNVGYYTAATRFTIIITGIITALQTTLLPRSSTLIAQSDIKSFKDVITKALNFIFCFSPPMIAGVIVMAPIIIQLFASSSFLPAILTLQILAFNTLFSILNAVICAAILVPLGKENIATLSCLLGGIINLILNFILIPIFAQNGSAISAIFTELTILLLMISLGHKYIPIKIFQIKYLRYIILSILMFGLCYFCWNLSYSEAYRLVIIPFVGICFYFSALTIIKDQFFIDILNIILKKLKISRLKDI